MSLLDTLAGAGEREVTTKVPVAQSVNTGGSVNLIPYNAIYDAQADAMLPWLWKKMQDDDLVDYYFPGQKETGFATFVRLMSGDANVVLVTRDDPSHQWEDTVAGFVTWTEMHLGATMQIVAGFIFFRKFWDHKLADETARKAFEYWFTKTDAQLVLGNCPSLHRLAIIFNKRVGLKEAGRLPMIHTFQGAPCDAILFVMTREDWQKERR